jgi:hypothetical protein
MAQPGIELVRDLIARFFNGHDPDLAPEFFAPDFRWHGGSVGTHTGALWGIPPTGNHVVWDVMMMYHLSNGIVVEQWAAEDWIAFLGAIGAFTPPWAGPPQ